MLAADDLGQGDAQAESLVEAERGEVGGEAAVGVDDTKVGRAGQAETAPHGRAAECRDQRCAEVEQLRGDEAIAEADTLLLTIPNQLGVDYCAHAVEAILTHVAPPLGWR